MMEDAIDHAVRQIADLVHDRAKLIDKPPSRKLLYYAYGCDVARPGSKDESCFIRASWMGDGWALERITEAEYCNAVPGPDAGPPGGAS